MASLTKCHFSGGAWDGLQVLALDTPHIITVDSVNDDSVAIMPLISGRATSLPAYQIAYWDLDGGVRYQPYVELKVM